MNSTMRFHFVFNNFISFKHDNSRGGLPVVYCVAADNCLLSYDNESNGFWRRHPISSNWILQRALCTSVLYNFSAKCLWKFSIARSLWRATKIGAELYFSSSTRYWTRCFGGTNVFCCSWQTWCYWQECLNWVMFLSSKFSIVSRYSNIVILVYFALTMLQFSQREFAIVFMQPSILQGEHWI